MDTYLFVGLGNPGAEYAFTRHNIGFMVLDRLQNGLSAPPFRIERYGWVTEATYKGGRIVLLKPSTFMNLSGQAVRFWMQQEKISIERTVIITDDLALPFGKLRLRTSGSGGGHNGLGNIESMLGTNNYPRLRFGIGNDFAKGRQVDYVLAPFSTPEVAALPEAIEQACQGLLSIPHAGMERAMNGVNTSK